jgi:hypothetical protein
MVVDGVEVVQTPSTNPGPFGVSMAAMCSENGVTMLKLAAEWFRNGRSMDLLETMMDYFQPGHSSEVVSDGQALLAAWNWMSECRTHPKGEFLAAVA